MAGLEVKRFLLTLVLAGAAAAQPTFDSGVISGVPARNIGSAAMSGRISALAARVEPDNKVTLFVGAASGGVWRSQDGGTTFKPVFDEQTAQSIGAIALDPTNPKRVWVGTGESWTRNSVSIGDGLYRSDDGGLTWTNVGLKNTERIARIEARGPVVYAAVPGPLWSDSEHRGLYQTKDGGQTWQHIIKAPNPSTGCSSVALDPVDPNHVLAGLWDFRRTGWSFRSGGHGPHAESGSGLHVSRDGGASWQEVTGGGLPAKPWGRVEIEFAPSNPKRVYAFIECQDSALYVSDDGGATWDKRDKSQQMVWRPFYFANLIVDPTNADRVFKTNLWPIVSDDAGKSFSTFAQSSHCDWHDLWVNPKNPQHLIGGDDGGLWISYDGGSRWVKSDNLPISQYYHVSLDDRDPYQIYGGLQDNSSWVGDSAYPGGITNGRWENLYGGDGFWMFSDPSDPDYVYAEYQGGGLARINRLTHSSRNIQPQAGPGEKLRFNWNTPLHLSPHEKGTLYMGAQFLFRTRDHGQTWQRISPDLSSNAPERQKQEESGGITVDNSSAEMHTTIYTISESPRKAGVIWVGTDDGQVAVTRDHGKTWTRSSVKPAYTVAWLEASRHKDGTAYMALDGHTFGDMATYLYRTDDYGKTWQRLGEGQPLRGYAHVLKDDPVAPGLLYAGTEFGLFVSPDQGRRWAPYKGGKFPAVAVRDLAVHPRDRDLVLGTHGRGIWIIDDITPWRALSDQLLASEVAFLPSRPNQQRIQGSGGWSEGDAHFVGANPPAGALIHYYQARRHLFGPLKLEVLDGQGQVLATLAPSKRRGLNRVTWNMRGKPPRVPKGAQVAFGATQGPRVLPGTYTVRLTKGDKVMELPLEISLDRRATYTLADRQAQLQAVLRVATLFEGMSQVTDRLVGLQKAALARTAELPALQDYAARLEALRKQIVATTEGGAITGEERLREWTENVYSALVNYEGQPAPYYLERIVVLEGELAKVQAQLAKLEAELPELNRQLKTPLTAEPVPSEAAERALAEFLGVEPPQEGSAR